MSHASRETRHAHERPLRADLSSELVGIQRWDVVTIEHGQAATHLAEGWEPIGGYYIPPASNSGFGGQRILVLRRPWTVERQSYSPPEEGSRP